MKVKHSLSVLLFLAACILPLPAAFSQGYEIKIKINNLRDTSVVLGHHLANNFIVDDTAKLNGKGIGVFSGKQKLPGGMYFVLLPARVYFDILIGEDQVFYMENDTSDFLNRFRCEGSLENQLFYDYQRFLVDKRNAVTGLQEKIKNTPSEAEKKVLISQIDNINKERLDLIKKITTENPKLFVSTFIKATDEVAVPDPPRDANGNITDSLFQYKYYRAHYFDNFDFTDGRLLRTPIYEGKFNPYFEKVIPQIPDSLISEVDKLIAQARKDPDVFRYVMVTLFNSYATSQIMGMDKVFVHIAEKYYIPEAKWSSSDFIEKLKKQVAERKPLLIGNTAPSIQLVDVPSEHFVEAQDDTAAMHNPYVGNMFTLSEVKAKFTILFFWDADCGHCQKTIPVLHDAYERLKDKDVKVIAIHILGGVEGKTKWIKFINDHQYYDWINAWNPYDFGYKEKYDVKSTPVLYLLDEQKKIVAKLISPEQAEEIIDHLLRQGKQSLN
jgi:thiol-disulfide isomerase/thioredoxin